MVFTAEDWIGKVDTDLPGLRSVTSVSDCNGSPGRQTSMYLRAGLSEPFVTSVEAAILPRLLNGGLKVGMDWIAV